MRQDQSPERIGQRQGHRTGVHGQAAHDRHQALVYTLAWNDVLCIELNGTFERLNQPRNPEKRGVLR